MELAGKVAVVTGGASGIGACLCHRLAVRERVRAIGVVDQAEQTADVCAEIGRAAPGCELVAFRGDVTDAAFRGDVFATIEERFGAVSLCVPAAGITRDRLSVKVAKTEDPSSVAIYPEDDFRDVINVDLIAPVYWALRAVASVAKDRARRGVGRWSAKESVEGAIVFIGSVAARGNQGQIAYSTAKAGLVGAQATLSLEAIYHGLRCTIIHPGFTDTPMARAMGDDTVTELAASRTLLGRLIEPDEIVDAICFLMTNASVTGTLWADAGWQPGV